MAETVHNPDRYMADLRQILAQGRKKIGILLGAGAPVSLKIDIKTGRLSPAGEPLMPAIAGLTTMVLDALDKPKRKIIDEVCKELGAHSNIEMILTRIRLLSAAIGKNTVHGFNGEEFKLLAEKICVEIGKIVSASLPRGSSPYTELVAWISGDDRKYPIEIFTPNYDLLLEEALEHARVSYFDGFSGAFEPFFDPSTVSNNDLPA